MIAHILYYFSKQTDLILDPMAGGGVAAEYAEKSISDLSKKEYLEFLESFFALLKRNAKKTTRLAFINFLA